MKTRYKLLFGVLSIFLIAAVINAATTITGTTITSSFLVGNGYLVTNTTPEILIAQDGSGDYNCAAGADCSATLNSVATAGTHVRFKAAASPYTFNSTITASARALTISCTSEGGDKLTIQDGCIFQAGSGLTDNFFNVTSSKFKLENIMIDGNSYSINGVALLTNSQGVTLRGLDIRNQIQNGIYVAADAATVHEFENIVCSNNGLHGMYLVGTDVRINNYEAHRNWNGAALMLNPGSGLQIEQSHFFKNKYGLYLNGTDNSNFVDIINENSTEYATVLDTAQSGINRLAFVANQHFYNDDATSVIHIDLTSNTINGVTWTTSSFDNTATMFSTTGTKDMTNSDFGLSNNVQASYGTYPQNLTVVSKNFNTGAMTMLDSSLIVDDTNNAENVLKLRRNNADSEQGTMYITDENVVFTSTQDEASGEYGGYKFLVDDDADATFEVGNSTNTWFSINRTNICLPNGTCI